MASKKKVAEKPESLPAPVESTEKKPVEDKPEGRPVEVGTGAEHFLVSEARFRLLAKAYKILTHEESLIDAEFNDNYVPEDKDALTAICEKIQDTGNELRTLALNVRSKAESAHGGEPQDNQG